MLEIVFANTHECMLEKDREAGEVQISISFRLDLGNTQENIYRWKVHPHMGDYRKVVYNKIEVEV